MIGIIRDIQNNTAKVESNGIITGFLPFAHVPFANFTPLFDYKIGDEVVFETYESSSKGAILGVIR